MGKIRVKTLGDEEAEQEKKRLAKIKKEQKNARKSAGGIAADQTQDVIPVLHHEVDSPLGGKTGIQEESGSRIKVWDDNKEIATSLTKDEAPRNDKKKKEKFAAKKKGRSKAYKTVATMVDKKKTYSLADALTLLEKVKRAKFDETVELHVNTTEAGISGSITLPHGSGKQVRVAIADPSTGSGQASMEELLKKVESGVVDFDILLATPAAMSKLAKVARILGPRGLMPNPKNGTVTANPTEAAKKFAGGLSHFKTEAKTPIIHIAIGKLSFGEKKLGENVTTAMNTINTSKIKNVTLKSTMSPGIKIATP